MTEQEAFKNLKNLFSEYELALPCTDSLETLQTAIKALEKQIPKKPIYEDFEENEDDEQDKMIRASRKANLSKEKLIKTFESQGLIGVYNLGLKNMLYYLEEVDHDK